jgi:hypothetical protein
MKSQEMIVEFCSSVKKGLGSITDSLVKTEFERVYETSLQSTDLATLLALLEKHELLDKKRCINKEPHFYQAMYKKMKASK